MKNLREIFQLRPTKPRTPTFRQGMQADQTAQSLRQADQTVLSLRQADQTVLSLRHGGYGNRGNRVLTPAVTTPPPLLALPQEVISPTPLSWWRPPPQVKRRRRSQRAFMGRKRLNRTPSSDDGESSRAAETKQRNLQECYETGDPLRTAADNDGSGSGSGSGMKDVEVLPDAKPLGDVIMTFGKGKTRIKYYNSFHYDGVDYELGDPVLVQPEVENDRPYVGLIKFITQEVDGSVKVTGQWLYRPEEAKQRSGGTWEALDERELFYSSHLDEVPAESVMHKCVVHFVPQNKKLPVRPQHPGFIVQRVYDFLEKRLWNLSDKDYKDSMQKEIDLLVQKTIERIGELPDIEPENSSAYHAVQTPRKNMEPSVVARNDARMETHGISTNDVPKYHLILSHFKALTGDNHRNKWLEKLLEGIRPATVNGSNENISEDGERYLWPNAAVEAITALEKATHVALGSDMHRYNLKMRQLVYNLKSTALTRRLLNKELDPAVVVNMTPNELKAGSVTEKTADPEESRTMQMTNARCSRCGKRNVGVAEVIHSCRGDRYQLECQVCGYSWYASPDYVVALVNDTPQHVVGDSAV